MRSSRWNFWRSTEEDGYATVAAAGFAACLVLLCGMLAWHSGAVIAAAQAQTAADLAAVAAAYRLALGEGGEHACATAVAVAELNGAEIHSCEILTEDVIVGAVIRGQAAPARAGPL